MSQQSQQGSGQASQIQIGSTVRYGLGQRQKRRRKVATISREKKRGKKQAPSSLILNFG